MADIEKEKGSAKKPGPPKCRGGCGAVVDEKEMVIIAGNKWHRACAEKKKKYVPKEYAEA